MPSDGLSLALSRAMAQTLRSLLRRARSLALAAVVVVASVAGAVPLWPVFALCGVADAHPVLAAAAFGILANVYDAHYGVNVRLQRVRLYETPNCWADFVRE